MKKNKKLIVIITILAILFGGTYAWYILRKALIKHFLSEFELPPAAVTTTIAKTETWNPVLKSVGTLKAVNGVEVNSQVAGQITKIYFKSGQQVKKGTPLIQLDDSVDQQTLINDLAQLRLNKLTYKRQKQLYKKNATSKSALDSAQAQMQESQAAVATARVMIQKKKIKAPFDGKLGIRQADIGQYISPGQALVLLQSLNPLYVNFELPEQNLQDVYFDQKIRIVTDAIKDKFFEGKINAIDSAVDVNTRSIAIQAILSNDKGLLYPGLFADVSVYLPKTYNVITVPQTAVTYSLYGDIIYVVKKTFDKKEDKQALIAVQKFVTVGERHGKVIEIKDGIQPGDEIVTSGQIKLNNGSRIVINNSIKLK